MDFIIRDFQSIEEAKIQVKGFTLLLGESSAGKSACLRALYAATHNRFKMGQVRNGQECATIKVRYEDDPRVLIVKRSATGSPMMKLGDQVFQKMSRSVPPQVEEFNNFGSLEVGDDKYSLNFHDQFDKPLLLEYSQRKVMEILSASKGIDDHNVVHYALSKKREQNRGALKTIDTLLSENNAKLSMVKFEIKEREPLIQQLNKLESQDDTISTELRVYDDLEDLLRSKVRITQKETLLTKLINSLEGINALKSVIGKFDELQQLLGVRNSTDIIISNAEKSVPLVERWNEITNLLSSYDLLLYYLSNKVELESRVNVLESKLNKIAELVEFKTKIKHQIDQLIDLDTVNKSFIVLNDRINNLEDLVDRNICPICNNKIK